MKLKRKTEYWIYPPDGFTGMFAGRDCLRGWVYAYDQHGNALRPEPHLRVNSMKHVRYLERVCPAGTTIWKFEERSRQFVFKRDWTLKKDGPNCPKPFVPDMDYICAVR